MLLCVAAVSNVCDNGDVDAWMNGKKLGWETDDEKVQSYSLMIFIESPSIYPSSFEESQLLQ